MAADEVKAKELPLPVRLFLDVIYLRSTPITAVFWCTFLLITLGDIAYSQGLLERYGFDGGFVRVSEEKKQSAALDARLTKLDNDSQTRVNGVNKKIDWQLKLSITRELRETTAVMCKSKSAAERDTLQRYIDQLVSEYKIISGDSVEPPPCPPK